MDSKKNHKYIHAYNSIQLNKQLDHAYSTLYAVGLYQHMSYSERTCKKRWPVVSHHL